MALKLLMSNFNSKMVRLEEEVDWLLFLMEMLFQFQNGTIRS